MSNTEAYRPRIRDLTTPVAHEAACTTSQREQPNVIQGYSHTNERNGGVIVTNELLQRGKPSHAPPTYRRIVNLSPPPSRNSHL